MVEFQVVCADPETGESYQVDVSGHHANSLVGKKIGDEVDGMFVDLPGYKLQVTGGTDEDGFPMRPELDSIGRKKVMVSESKGFHPTRPGQRKKKAFRGNTISPEVTQVNMRIVEWGDKDPADLLEVSDEAEPPEDDAEEEAPQDDEAEEAEEAEAEAA